MLGGRTGENVTKQNVIRGTLLRQFPLVCGGLFASNLSFVTESKISNVFDIFCHSWYFAYCVRR